MYAHLTRHTAMQVEDALVAQIRRGEPVTLDLSTTREMDSAGVAILWRVRAQARAQNVAFRLVGIHPAVARTLDLFPDELTDTRPALETTSWSTAFFVQLATAQTVLTQFFTLTADLVTFAGQMVFGRRGFRAGMVTFEMVHMGSRAAGVVGLIAFLVGVTIALQSAVQLRQLGAPLLVADLIGVAITRELGPLMAAIVLAGRSGAAIAAEIGTMVITEEIDALKTMGINPIRYVVLPKLLALCAMQPLLTVLANSLAILGGAAVATVYLDVGIDTFFSRLFAAVELKDIATGLIKAFAFAMLIVLTAALCGLRSEGGPEAVGRSTTQSVVAAIFAIIVADAFFSLVFYFGA